MNLPEWKWILNGKVPEPCSDTLRWARWYEDNFLKRHVADDYFADEAIRVSTIFTGLNTRVFGPPELFETIIFVGGHNEGQWRYSTWDQAEAGHKRACEIVRMEIEQKQATADVIARIVIGKMTGELT